MSTRPYRGGRVFSPVVVVPPGELTELRLGQLVEVYSVFKRLTLRVGEVVHFIEANTVPDASAMEVLWRVNKLATAADPEPVPTRASKYRRVILKNRSGRCFAYAINPHAHRFYAASTKEVR